MNAQNNSGGRDLQDFDPIELRRELQSYKKRLPDLTVDAYSAVRRWRMADSQMHNWRPFSTEEEGGVLYGRLRGERKWLSWLTGLKRRFLRRELSWFWFSLIRLRGPHLVFDHGFDRDGVLRIIDREDSKIVFIYRGDLVDAVHFDDSSESISLDRYLLVNGVAHVIIEVSEGSVTEERFVVEEGRFIRSARRYWNIDQGQLDSVASTTHYFYEQDSQGRLSKVLAETHHDGRLLYRRIEYVRPSGITKENAARRLEDLMVEKIPAVVREARVVNPSYALMICYCGEDISCSYPGLLVFAPEVIRQRFVGEHKDDPQKLHYYLWAPDEVRSKAGVIDLSLDDLDMQEAACEYFELCKLGDFRLDFDGLLQPIHSAARRLNKLNWSSILPVTDDFVVTALDNTGECNARSDIVACVPTEKVMVLESNGMLSPEAD